MRNYQLIFFAALLTFSGCKTSKSTSSSTLVYEENLAVLRPDLTVEESEDKPIAAVGSKIEIDKLNISTQLDSVNQQIIVRNQSVRYKDGYTIQIYTGNSRDEADQAKALALIDDPSLKPVISYYQPSYKVKVGQFATRLEAHKTYESLKKQFPRALLVPERIRVNYE